MRRARQRVARWVTQLVLLAVGGALGATVVALGVALLGPSLVRIVSAAEVPQPTIAELRPLSERSHVYDVHGREIAVLRSEQNREEVPLSSIPEHVVQAVLDVEDADFYRHKGVDVRSMARALFANVEAGGVEQGGSTITQQLVKNALLDGRKDLQRKVREARLALALERTMSKEGILERYLNTVYLGQGAYGVQAGAERYFGKQAGQLTKADAAFLAGMIRNPVGYDPVRFPDRSRARRAVVLDRMVQRGHLTSQEAAAYAAAPLPRPKEHSILPDTYFVEEVKQRLLDDRRLGATARDRYQAVFNGGLRIHTTFDPQLQAQAEAAVTETLAPTEKPEFTASLVALEPSTGAVRALVGGRGFTTDKYNLATQGKRQPGSSWKPFTLAAAIEAGYSPRSIISGYEPCAIPNPGGTPDPYEPGNYEGARGQTASLVEQITYSNNCAFARLAYIVGIDQVISVARRLGITTRLDAVPALALGTEEVRPIEMAGAYATFAADGMHHTPYLIERVDDRNGKPIFRADHKGRRAISVQTARVVVDALQQVVRRGTGTKARLKEHDVAGKTGTAQNYEDAWFVGFTPQLVTAVWMGAPAGKIPMRNVGGIRVTGGSYPATIWHEFMAQALADVAAVEFEEPDDSLYGKATCLQVKAPKGYKPGGSASSKSSKSKAKSSKATTSKSSSSKSASIGLVSGRGFGLHLASSKSARSSRSRGCGDLFTYGSSKSSKSSSKKSSSKTNTVRRTKSTRVKTRSTGVDRVQAPVEVQVPVPVAVPAPAPDPSPAPEGMPAGSPEG